MSVLDAARVGEPGDPGAAPARRWPAEPGFWFFIAGEMGDFTLLFFLWVVTRAHHPAEFAAGQRLLDPTFGAVDTLLLLTSSLLVAVGLGAWRRGRPGPARAGYLGAMACGVAFTVSKLLEWNSHIAIGQDIHAGDFWMYYFVLTGLHLAHVLLGIAVLVWCARQVAPGRGAVALSPRRLGFLEGGSIFWHMVDLLWILLFALIYLVR